MVKIPEIYEIGNGIPFPDYTNGTVINAADVGPINGIAHSRLFTINQPGWVYLYSYSESLFRINITGAPDPTTLAELHTFPFVAKNYTGGQAYMDCISFIPVQRACKIYLNNEVNSDDQTTHSLIIHYPFVKSPVTPPEGCVSYVIETGHNNDNTAFYRKYSDGYIEQWGEVYKTQNGTIDFVIPFVLPHLPADAILNGETRRISGLNIQVQVYDATGVIDACEVGNVTRTGFDVLNSAAGTSNAFGIMWRACGY